MRVKFEIGELWYQGLSWAATGVRKMKRTLPNRLSYPSIANAALPGATGALTFGLAPQLTNLLGLGRPTFLILFGGVLRLHSIDRYRFGIGQSVRKWNLVTIRSYPIVLSGRIVMGAVELRTASLVLFVDAIAFAALIVWQYHTWGSTLCEGVGSYENPGNTF